MRNGGLEYGSANTHITPPTYDGGTRQGSSATPSLHALVRRVKLLVAQLEITLEVVHAPGELVIQHGADGLSRGLCVSISLLDAPLLLAYLFSSVNLTEALLLWVWFHLSMVLKLSLPPNHQCPVITDTSNWSPDFLLHRTSVWIPSPHLAWQAMSHLASTWVNSPWDTAAIIMIPRIFTCMWSKMNKHFQLVSTVKQDNCLQCPWNSPLPLCLLYLSNYVWVPSAFWHHTMDRTALPSNTQWHSNQAKLVCGL
eukprot:3909819-Ditylum_brightwellii.AAC.1